MKNDPVFIQALWRTGSTYLWGKFRAYPELRCFFEPLHESLFCKTRDQLQKDFERASGKFGHDVSRNYYEEYDVLPAGGVPGFRRRFSVEQYVLDKEKDDSELETYIAGLIFSAQTTGKTPVLQFNRGILRGEWMKERFGGTHFYLNRNPNDILRSYQKSGYYIPSYLMIIGQNAEHPVFAEIAEHFGLEPYDYRQVYLGKEMDDRQIDSKGFHAMLLHYTRQARKLKLQDQRDIVAFFWTLGIAEASHYADLFVDTDRIIEGKGRKLPVRFQDLTGLTVGFQDYRAKGTFGDSTMNVSKPMKRIIRNAVAQTDPNLDVLQLGGACSRFGKTKLSKNTAIQLVSTLE